MMPHEKLITYSILPMCCDYLCLIACLRLLYIYIYIYVYKYFQTELPAEVCG